MKRVPVEEVKRCFVVSDLGKPAARTSFTGPSFKSHLQAVKRRVLKMDESALDRHIHKTYRKRLHAFTDCVWYEGTISPKEAGVWPRAGGLPLAWTNRTLAETAAHVLRALESRSKRLKRRSRSAIPGILAVNVHLIQKERYLLPIVFKENAGTKPRKRLKHRTKYEIDDGCMRSIALTMHGAKRIRVYIGIPKRASTVH